MLLTPARLTWRQGTPYATDFDDLYYTDQSKDGGINEVRHFFVQPSGLLSRTDSQTWLTVGELGFGTGLNLAVLAQDLLAQYHNVKLHFISVESHPLGFHDWQRLARVRPNLQIAQDLAQDPLPLLTGWHHRVFAQGRVRLSVFYGDALEGWQSWQANSQAGIDAWFMDGFAPDRNAAIWSAQLCELMAKISSAYATVSTFTAAGEVRRRLTAAGFQMQKASRTPYKREALVGTIRGPRASVTLPTQVSVAGAGIGGCSVARALADLGVSVRLFDPAGVAQEGEAEGASKIAQAVLHARLIGNDTADAQLRAHAFHCARHMVTAQPGFSATGVLQLQGPNMDQAKLQRISATFAAQTEEQSWWVALTAADALQEFGLNHDLGDALYFPRGGIMNIPIYCRALAQHPNIEVVHEPHSDQDHLQILCNGAHARHEFDWLELSQVSGQLDHFEHAAQAPTTPVVGNGYCVPDPPGHITLGATYEYQGWDQTRASQHNIDLNDKLVMIDPGRHIGVSRGVRTVSSDRLPVVGMLTEQQWIATGFASMGTTMAPYAASLISAQVAGWAPPATDPIIQALSPTRFLKRQARRGKRHGATQDLP